MNELEPVQIIHNLMKKREEKLFSNSEPIPGFMTSSESIPKKASPEELNKLRERLHKRKNVKESQQ